MYDQSLQGQTSLILNVGNGRGIETMELVSFIQETWLKDLWLDFQPLRTGETLTSVADTTKMNRLKKSSFKYSEIADLTSYFGSISKKL
jgi:UDP-glucose 4-epimerase